MASVDWDQYFISGAYLAARKSKDRSTQVGAVIVGPDHECRSTGYNGPPRGFDDADEAIHQRPLKYDLFEHAERNAIYNAARIGVSTKGCAMFCTFHPCSQCARALVQSGIIELVLHQENPGGSPEGKWAEDRKIAELILRQGGVSVRWWSGAPIVSSILCNGMLHDLTQNVLVSC